MKMDISFLALIIYCAPALACLNKVVTYGEMNQNQSVLIIDASTSFLYTVLVSADANIHRTQL